jgi:hypothetical protein
MKWRDFLIASAGILLVLAFGMFAWPRIEHYRLTGSFWPIDIIESLKLPVAVKHWTANGLHLVDGRKIQLQGFKELPEKSDALAEVINNGVELGTNGRLYGLVRVNHWCPNDPVRKHIAKVDIAKMLTYLGEDQLISGRKDNVADENERRSVFSEWGWEAGDYGMFQHWSVIPDDILERMENEAEER